MKLFTYWRSQASYRVRIALALKGFDAELVTLDLLKGDQFADGYRALNPEMVVPTLVEDGHPPLSQSLAILEFLEERHPEPPLLPADAYARARVRALAQVVAMDAHPFIVPRVRKYLEHELGLPEAMRNTWLAHWLTAASHAVESMLAHDPRTGRFCHGDQVSVADICLVAHFTSAKMLCELDMEAYPTAARIFSASMQLDAFTRTHPLRQPDAPKAAS
ncbi:MAG: maleylacetoacetate isomerase [Xanthobacteraceae bacterium]